MKVSPEAVIIFEEYQKQRNTARILGWISIGAIITAYSIRDNDWQVGLLAGGTIISFASIPITIRAGKNFKKAIWVRNREVLK